jgi:predicted anti-sigma-YlaC factor YlaD
MGAGHCRAQAFGPAFRGASIAAAALIRMRRALQTKRMDMTAEGDAKEVTVHRIGYDRFVTLMRWSAGVCVVIAFIVILLIAK